MEATETTTRPRDWRLTSPAFILGDPATSVRRYDMSDYSEFDTVTKVMVYQPVDPLADGTNGRSSTEGVFEVDAAAAEGLPLASSEQRARALRLIPRYGSSVVIRGAAPSIIAPKRMRAEAIAEATVANTLNDAWRSATEIERGSEVILGVALRKFKDRRAIGADEIGTVIWEGSDRPTYGYGRDAVRRLGVRYPDGTTIFRSAYDFKVANPADEMPDFETTVQAAYGQAYENAMATLPENPMLFDWANAVPVGETERGNWYDETTYDVPFSGPYDGSAAHATLNADTGTQAAMYGKFGGYSSYRVVGDNGNGTFRVKQVYHIGD